MGLAELAAIEHPPVLVSGAGARVPVELFCLEPLPQLCGPSPLDDGKQEGEGLQDSKRLS